MAACSMVPVVNIERFSAAIVGALKGINACPSLSTIDIGKNTFVAR
jgi:hypothetical protein